MNHNHSVLVAGHICLDIIPSLDHFNAGRWETSFRPGMLLEVGPAALMTGGSVSNTGLTLHKLGISTRLMGKVGADAFGQTVLNLVRSMGQDLADSMIVDDRSYTSYSIIISPPGVDRIFLHCPGANNTFCAMDVDTRQAAGVDLFHFGYPPIMQRMFENDGLELAHIFQEMKGLGVTTSLDLAFPDPASRAAKANWPEIFRRSLPYVDLFMPSIEELLFMHRRADYEAMKQQASGSSLLNLVTPELLDDLSSEMIRLGAKVVALKLGERGLYLRTADAASLRGMGKAAPLDLESWAGRELWAPCFQVPVAGTTGSGDATIAGFLSGLLRDYSPEAALTSAVAVGACNVEAPDALNGIRPWEETMQRIQNGWARLPLSISAPGWRWEPGAGLWVGPAAAIRKEGN